MYGSDREEVGTSMLLKMNELNPLEFYFESYEGKRRTIFESTKKIRGFLKHSFNKEHFLFRHIFGDSILLPKRRYASDQSDFEFSISFDATIEDVKKLFQIHISKKIDIVSMRMDKIVISVNGQKPITFINKGIIYST